MLILEVLIDCHRTVQLQLLQHYWSVHRLGLLWYWMITIIIIISLWLPQIYFLILGDTFLPLTRALWKNQSLLTLPLPERGTVKISLIFTCTSRLWMVKRWSFGFHIQSLPKAKHNIMPKNLGSRSETHMNLTLPLGSCVTLSWWLNPSFKVLIYNRGIY